MEGQITPRTGLKWFELVRSLFFCGFLKKLVYRGSPIAYRGFPIAYQGFPIAYLGFPIAIGLSRLWIGRSRLLLGVLDA